MRNQPVPSAPVRKAVSVRSKLTAFLITLFLVLLALAVILPLLLPFMFVFKTRLEYNYHPWSWPTEIRWTNFIEAWRAIQIGQGLLNTIFVCLGAIVCTVPAAAMAGYIFARYRSKVTEVIFYFILAGYFVPVQMVLIPLYQLCGLLNITDTLPGLFLPMTAFGIPFWTIIYRSFFMRLPNELAEAARIDGAGHTNIFLRIMLPLAKPATVLATLLVFMGAWSDYLLSLIMINSAQNYTMQLRIAQFMNQYGVDHMPRYAAATIIAAAPTVILYIIGHRWIIQSTLAGALKG
ncbi:carbohydrate ABC transporter permease [Hydrogenispora sp. UU3]|uniref:Carbohydrate ABC transporter permease n=1 Tax=Capillibacterium thermochitinicola TaxID=2699427 RepID=A0A8J6HYH2_9FIRM|nr:carbohydrate ABC transporter permease [Capillibacterium thermochitinicola]